jgi:2-oxoglutarate dehydrogenase E2 component (dihydrolipoamide succinyltransferase)
MKVEIKIPTMGESVSEATVSALIALQGSAVAADAEIIELETDKVNQVLYAPAAGQLNFTVKVGDKVVIGQVIGFIDTEAAAPAKAPPPVPTPIPTPASAPKAPPPPPPPQSSGPSARHTSAEYASEISAPLPSLPPPAAVASSFVTRKPMSNLRKVVAKRMVEAKNSTAMLTTFNEVDMSAVIDIRNREKDHFLEKNGVKLGFMSFFVKGVVAALKAIPEVNSALDGEEILLYHNFDICIAVSTERGLMVPVLRSCHELTYAGIESAIGDLAKRARTGKITVDELRGGSFTITNAGIFGSLFSTPILNPPQSAILGMHNIVKRPVVVGDQIVIRPMMYIALSYDHRVIDGREAVLFLVRLKEYLEDPARLLLEG